MGDDKVLELRLGASQPSKLHSLGSALRSTYPEVYEGLDAAVVQLMLHLTVLPSGMGSGSVEPLESAEHRQGKRRR
jgi:hypothetical protein